MGLSKAERRLKKYGPPGYYEHVVGKGCIVGNVKGYANCSRKIDFAHGHGEDGQTYKSGFGCCHNHHTARGDSFHQLGVETFQKRHGVNCQRVAEENVREWEEGF